MYRSLLETSHGEVEVVAVLDDDDATRHWYPSGPTYITIAAGSMLQSNMWNVAWEHATGDIAHLGADDLIFRTPGWDTQVARVFERTWAPDHIGMVYVNDLHEILPNPPYVFACNPFVSREWIEAAGFFTPPYYESWESDTWIFQLAQGISRVQHIPDVIVEHMHPMSGKAEIDDTYRRGAWVNAGMRRRGFALTRSAKMRRLRATQMAALTERIQSTRRQVIGA